MVSNLTPEQRTRIALRYHLYTNGCSEIRGLDDVRRHPTKRREFLCARGSCQKIFEKLKTTGSVLEQARSGRPTIKTPQLEAKLVKAIRKNRKAGVKETWQNYWMRQNGRA